LGARFARTHRYVQVQQDTTRIVASGAAPALFPPWLERDGIPVGWKGTGPIDGIIRDERADHPNTLKFEAPLTICHFMCLTVYRSTKRQASCGTPSICCDPTAMLVWLIRPRQSGFWSDTLSSAAATV
jgi:hypothetical protein